MEFCVLKLFSFISASNGEDVLNPMYSALEMVGPYALGIVVALCIFYGIFLGVKFARASGAEEKANARKILINFLIGAGVIIALIGILYAIREPLATLIDS